MRSNVARGLLALLQLAAAVPAAAEAPQSDTSATSGATASNTQGRDPKLARRKRSRVSRPAEFEGAGLLQLEFGYDGNFDAPSLDADQAGTLSLLFNASSRVQLELGFDAVTSPTDSSGARASGLGDTTLGVQLTALKDTAAGPSLALAYVAKLPTASQAKGLGSGRSDHKFIALTSEQWRGYDFDFNAALVLNGRSGGGSQTGAQLSAGVTRDFEGGVGLQAELFGETLDTDQPRGVFAALAASYQVGPRFTLDLGVRVGLDSRAPRIGVFAGLAVALANLYEFER